MAEPTPPRAGLHAVEGEQAGHESGSGGRVFKGRLVSQRRRFLECVAAGLVVAAIVAWFAPWQLTVLAGWDTAAALILVRIWARIAVADGNETRALASREDDSRASTGALLVNASVASLLGVASLLIEAGESSGTQEVVLIATAIVTVVMSWAIVHTVFTLRYADEYYTDPVGGIAFSGKRAPDAVDPDAEPPDYRDFAYVAFTIGMTFQVSDTDVDSRVIRRTVLRHALLSYLFGACILATLVNVVGSLINA